MMLQILLISLTIFYLVIAFCVYTQWLKIMQRDVCIKSQILVYKLFLMIATILWPIVVPLAYLELISKVDEPLDEISEQAQAVGIPAEGYNLVNWQNWLSDT